MKLSGRLKFLPVAMHCIPLRLSMAIAGEVAKQVMFGALDNLFKSNNVKSKDFGTLLVDFTVGSIR